MKKFSVFQAPNMSGGKRTKEIISKTVIYIFLILLTSHPYFL